MSTLARELGFLARRELALVMDQRSPRGNDWRGLVDKMGFSYEVNMVLNQHESPTLALLEEWERTFGSKATLDTLIGLVESLECQEAADVLRKAKAEKRDRIGPLSHRGSTASNTSTDSESSSRERGFSIDSVDRHPLTPCNSLDPTQLDSDMIARVQQATIDPLLLRDRMEHLAISEEDEDPHTTRNRSRSELAESLAYIRSQRYDVFLSFSRPDEEFAEEVRQRLVTQARMRVFVPSDELMPGRVFSDQIADMIKRGCRKTIIILSPDYLRSEWCGYEARLAHHQSPECKLHILIPILYKKCEVPAFMAHIYYLDYPRYRDNPQQCEKYFWNRLYKSLMRSP